MALRYAVADAAFNVVSTWALTKSGSPGASVPVAGDQVILNGFNVTMDVVTSPLFLLITSNGSSYSGYDGGNLAISLTSSAYVLNAALIEGGTSACVTVTGTANNFIGNFTTVTGGGQAGGTGILITGTAAKCTINATSITGNLAAGISCGTASPLINAPVASIGTAAGGNVTTGTVTVTRDITGSPSSSGLGFTVAAPGGGKVIATANLIDTATARAVAGPFANLQWNPALATNYWQFVSSGGNVRAYPSTSSTDPGIANVMNGTAYLINGASLTGTLASSGGKPFVGPGIIGEVYLSAGSYPVADLHTATGF